MRSKPRSNVARLCRFADRRRYLADENDRSSTSAISIIVALLPMINCLQLKNK
jgi:hypothetical protein